MYIAHMEVNLKTTAWPTSEKWGNARSKAMC